MKKGYYIIVTVAAALSVHSCVNLDTASRNSLMSKNMWNTEALVDAGVAGIYGVFYGDPNAGFDFYPRAEKAVSHARVEICGFTSQEEAHTFFFNSSTYSAGDALLSLEWKYCYEEIY